MMGYYVWLHSNPKLVDALRRENEACAASYMAFIRRISAAISGIASVVVRAASRLRQNTGRSGNRAPSDRGGQHHDVGVVRQPPALFEVATALEITALGPRQNTAKRVAQRSVRKAA